MKNIIYLAIITILLSSCGNKAMKKRKACKGNGSWYGNRHLGNIQTYEDVYVLK
jgi:hypothetical protein